MKRIVAIIVFAVLVVILYNLSHMTLVLWTKEVFTEGYATGQLSCATPQSYTAGTLPIGVIWEE